MSGVEEFPRLLLEHLKGPMSHTHAKNGFLRWRWTGSSFRNSTPSTTDTPTPSIPPTRPAVSHATVSKQGLIFDHTAGGFVTITEPHFLVLNVYGHPLR